MKKECVINALCVLVVYSSAFWLMVTKQNFVGRYGNTCYDSPK